VREPGEGFVRVGLHEPDVSKARDIMGTGEHMPELHWTWGYPAALGVMASVCTLLYRTFRRNHGL
jgi:hypothetical protein